MNLSAKDFSNWVQALSCQPRIASELMPWIDGALRNFFPFKRLFCCHGELIAGQIRLTHWRSIGHEPRYLEQLAKTFELAQRGSVAWWLANREPFYIDPKRPVSFTTEFEIAEISEFSLENIAAHGILNMRANAGTYFSFAGISEPLGDWHLQALKLIAPVLNDLFLSFVVAEISTLPNLADLTPRKASIVRQIALGLDDKTIAKTLGITEKTVRNQLSEIYREIGIHKRAQLIALLR